MHLQIKCMNKTDTILKHKITDYSRIFFSVSDLAKTSLYTVTFPSSPLTKKMSGKDVFLYRL